MAKRKTIVTEIDMDILSDLEGPIVDAIKKLQTLASIEVFEPVDWIDDQWRAASETEPAFRFLDRPYGGEYRLQQSMFRMKFEYRPMTPKERSSVRLEVTDYAEPYSNEEPRRILRCVYDRLESEFEATTRERLEQRLEMEK